MKNVVATSFVNERTVEYSMVSYLKNLLSKHFMYVLPISPWLNREASSLSKDVHRQDSFHVLALFARRPKVSADGSIYVTINEDLLTFKKFADAYSVMTIAGCPLARNFWELSTCHSFVKFDITESATLNYFNLVQKNYIISECHIQEMAIHIKRSEPMTITDLAEFLQEAKYALPRRYIFGPKYRPVYFILR